MTPAVVVASAFHDPRIPESLILDNGNTVRLRAGSSTLALRVWERYALSIDSHARAAERWNVARAGYMYHIVEWDSLREVLAFHWQPWQGDEREPHLHVGPALRNERTTRNIHVPTGQVLLPDVVRFLITELDAEPRRRDWDAALADAHAALATAAAP